MSARGLPIPGINASSQAEYAVAERHVVGAILHDGAGQVFLQQRDHKPGLRYPGWWTIFGGTVEPGETPDAAIAHELMEEFDLVLPLRLWWNYVCPVRTQAGNHRTRNYVYIGEITPARTRELTLYEGQAMGWFQREQALELPLAFEQQLVIARFFSEGESS